MEDSAPLLLWASLIGFVGVLGLVLAWLVTGRRHRLLLRIMGVLLILASVARYVATRPETPVAGRGSLVGAQPLGAAPDRCTTARAFSATIPPECR